MYEKLAVARLAKAAKNERAKETSEKRAENLLKNQLNCLREKVKESLLTKDLRCLSLEVQLKHH